MNGEARLDLGDIDAANMYALRCMSPNELRAYAAKLAHCRAVLDYNTALARVMQALAAMAEPVEPPASVRTELLSRID